MTTQIKTSTGVQPVDPYVAKGHEDLPLSQKMEDLVKFMNDVKYGMLTTQTSGSELLTSRCMALAATVCINNARLMNEMEELINCHRNTAE